MKRLTTDEFIERARNVHGNKYDYSKSIYTGSRDKLVIICPKHGEFLQEYRHHVLNGTNCPKCVVKMYHDIFKYSTEEFISKAIKIHGDKYDYSKINYINNKTKIKIICPKHGEFNQRPSSHLEGYGCKLCKETIGERNVRLFLEKHNINYIPQYKFKDCKKIKPLLFDFYLPDHNICIEYNGLQHYEHNHFFTSKKGFEELKERDNIKNKYCKMRNIKMIIIKYDDDILSKLYKLTG